MRQALKWLFRTVLVLLVLALAVGVWKREEITRLMAVNSLFAEDRIVPTAATALGFLAHFRHGIQVKLDLQFSLHFEARNRGILPVFGFAPILAIGWSPSPGGP